MAQRRHAPAAREYYVYIMTGRSGTFYVGVTNDLERRVHEHKAGLSGFTSRYRLNRLVYYEPTTDVGIAIAREKQLKSWRREKKIRLIKTLNPRFLDLSETWASSNGVAPSLVPAAGEG